MNRNKFFPILFSKHKENKKLKKEVSTLKKQVEFWVNAWYRQRDSTGNVAWREYYRGVVDQNIAQYLDQSQKRW